MASVIIIVKNRSAQLYNILHGLSLQTVKPDEVIIIHMNEEIISLSDHGLPIRQCVCEDEEVAIPLGKARNMGAELAESEELFFLDVDCIPSPGWLEHMLSELIGFHGLLMGNIAYLSRNETTGYTKGDHHLSGKGTFLPFRPVPPDSGKVTDTDYSLFWSLNFAIYRQDFLALGGFDESFKGYGAEDTDLAFRARNEKLPFGICKALVYHQYHDIYDPPVNHFQSIVQNARLFNEKHGIYPMLNWLKEFEEAGWLIVNEDLTVLRQPTEEEIEARKVSDGRSFK